MARHCTKQCSALLVVWIGASDANHGDSPFGCLINRLDSDQIFTHLNSSVRKSSPKSPESVNVSNHE